MNTDRYGAGAAFKRAWTCFILALTLLPYAWCRWLTPKGYAYSWIIPPYPADSFAYMAWSRQAYNGSILFSFKHTAIPHAPFLFHPFFLVCGRLARLTRLDLGLVHLLMRSAGVVLFFLAFFKLIEHFKLSRMQSAAAAVLVGISSGFGGLLRIALGEEALKQIRPLDLSLVDSNTFWSLEWNPLYPYSLALMLFAVYRIDRAASRNDPRDAWWGGLSLGLLALIHPYSIALLWPLLAVICAVRLRTRAFAILGRVFAASSPGILYSAAISIFHPLVRRHSTFGEMASPVLADYLLGFGLPLMLAMAGAYFHWEFMRKRFWPLLLWIALAFALAYFPFWFQKKLIFGVHVPICIIAGISFDLFLSRIPERRRGIAAIAAAALLLPLVSSTQLELFKRCLKGFEENRDHSYRIDNDLMDALAYLREHSRPSDIVFASLETSAKIAAYSGNTVLWGHWAQAIDEEERADWNRRIFEPGSDWNDREKSHAFWDAGIKYVFLDSSAKEFVGRHPPAWLAAGMDKLFENRYASIYKRKDAPGP